MGPTPGWSYSSQLFPGGIVPDWAVSSHGSRRRIVERAGQQNPGREVSRSRRSGGAAAALCRFLFVRILVMSGEFMYIL